MSYFNKNVYPRLGHVSGAGGKMDRRKYKQTVGKNRRKAVSVCPLNGKSEKLYGSAYWKFMFLISSKAECQ